MKNSIKGASVFFLLFWLPLYAMAGQELVHIPDSAGQETSVQSFNIRTIEKETLTELQADDEMNYQLASPEDNLWVQFRNWLFLQLIRLFGTEGATTTLEVIIYGICLLALTYAILKLLNVDISGLFSARNRRAVLSPAEGVEQDNIHEIDFQAAISEALRAKEYNKAVRLLYLSALKELSTREHIYWQPGKTNFQYQQELKASHLQNPFRQLGLFFEYAWYGNFQMSEKQYQQAESMYQSLHQNLKGGK